MLTVHLVSFLYVIVATYPGAYGQLPQGFPTAAQQTAVMQTPQAREGEYATVITKEQRQEDSHLYNVPETGSMSR